MECGLQSLTVRMVIFMGAQNLASIWHSEINSNNDDANIQQIYKNISSIRQNSFNFVGLPRWAFLEASDHLEMILQKTNPQHECFLYRDLNEKSESIANLLKNYGNQNSLFRDVAETSLLVDWT